MKIKKELVEKFIRFFMIGITSTLIHGVSLAVYVQKLHFAVMYANLLAFCTAFTFSLVGHNVWSFKVNRKYRDIFLKFLAISLINLTVHQTSMYITVQLIHIYYIIGFLISCFAVMTVSFTLNHLLVFKQAPNNINIVI